MPASRALRRRPRITWVYDPDAPSAWCNTLRFDYHESYAPALIGVPGGIGLSYYPVTAEQLEQPVKSRYVLADADDHAILSAARGWSS